MNKTQAIGVSNLRAPRSLRPLPLRNPVTNRNEVLHPDMPFYGVISETGFNLFAEVDSPRVLKVMTLLNVESELQRLSGIKKNQKLKSDIICTLCNNIASNLALIKKGSPQVLFEYIRQATRVIYSISLFVDENPAQFKRDHERVCKFILEIKAYIRVTFVPCLIDLDRHADAIPKARDALEQLSKVKSSYSI